MILRYFPLPFDNKECIASAKTKGWTLLFLRTAVAAENQPPEQSTGHLSLKASSMISIRIFFSGVIGSFHSPSART